ncbi:MAG: selenium cofactor biosynthesis protein YqeC [Gammaproteobacteria bacterium]
MAGSSPLLIDLLGVRDGITCVVGAGGKKSLLYRLVREHPARVALTATVHTTRFPADLPVARVVDDVGNLSGLVAAADRSRSVAYACPSGKPGRHAGVDPATIRAIHDDERFVATFVKADGARMRGIKAPSEDEPVLVPGVTTVVPVLSVGSVGEALTDRIAHRPERIEAITGLVRGATVTPEALGRLLASEQGGLRGAAGADVAPVINMVDNDRREELARAAAVAALSMTTRFDRVVLCCLKRTAEPVVAVVTR